MHIPDGYLSPQTCAVMGAMAAPIIGTASVKIKKTLKDKQMPLLAMGSAFSFTIMMYNIPIPDGTTAHAVGASILAIILGPWAATVGVSIALIIQAFFFGDGGILALGANIFNMAFVMPFVSYYLYRTLSGSSEVNSKRRFFSAAVAGYAGISAAALCAGIELGIQPLLFHLPDGTPLYSPYTLGQTVPAMMFAHLTFAGSVEGVVTGLVVKYLQKTNIAMLEIYPSKGTAASGLPGTGVKRKYWYALVALILFTPLGLLARGTAYGEGSGEDLRSMIGYVPQGMARLGDIWSSIMPDYTVPGLSSRFSASALGYIFCAIAALAMILAVTSIISAVMRKKNNFT